MAVVFVSGTSTLFSQTAAPTGWTKVTTYDDYALRVVSGSAGSGGSVNFSSVHGSKTIQGSISFNSTTDNTALTLDQIPSHSHTQYYNSPTFAVTPGGSPAPAGTPYQRGTNTVASTTTNPTGSGVGHNHPFGSLNFTGSSFNFGVNYVDVILASKN